MSSIHKQAGKPNWFCAFYDPEGFRKFRSTGTENTKIARMVCTAMERASTLARQGKLSNEKANKLVRETCAQIEEMHGKLASDAAHRIIEPSVQEFVKIAGGELTAYTTRSWLNSWLTSRSDVTKATVIEYRRILDLFLKHLGARADRSLTTLSASQIEEFKESLIRRVAPSTVNKAIKVLKSAFANAVAKRQLEFSPAEHITSIEVEESLRRPFTVEEIQKLLKESDPQWKTMVLVGYYTAQRLADCANLTAENVDLVNAEIRLRTEKTNRVQIIPMHPTLLDHLSSLPVGDDPKAPICPALYNQRSSWLSSQFHGVMVKAGLAEARDAKKKSTGKGRDAKRDLSRISFHSLRHTTTSALKSAGVSDAVAMDIVGHESEAISRNYTKISAVAKREAMTKLPDLLT